MTTDLEILKETKEAFLLFDKDNNGIIDISELASFMKSLNMNPTMTELQDMMNDMDGNGNGTIEFEEFVAMLSRQSEIQEEARETFRVFDKDGNGYLCKSELRQIMTLVGEELSDSELSLMLHEADEDGDGQIDFDEFVKMLAK